MPWKSKQLCQVTLFETEGLMGPCESDLWRYMGVLSKDVDLLATLGLRKVQFPSPEN